MTHNQITSKKLNRVSDFNIVCSMGQLAAIDRIIDCRPCGNNQLVVTYQNTGTWTVYANTGTAYQVQSDDESAYRMHEFLNDSGAPNTLRFCKQTVASSYYGM